MGFYVWFAGKGDNKRDNKRDNKGDNKGDLNKVCMNECLRTDKYIFQKFLIRCRVDKRMPLR